MEGILKSIATSSILSVVVGTLSLVSPSWAEIECGMTIGPKAKVTLTQNLDCTGAGQGLTLESFSTLNLGGNTIDCGGAGGTGVQIKGRGSLVRNGSITNCVIGIQVGEDEGPSGHTVTGVTARGNFLGFIIISKKNQLKNNEATGSQTSGFLIAGNKNFLKKNRAQGNQTAGFATPGGSTGSTFIQNRALSNDPGGGGGAGFIINGSRHRVIKNYAENNLDGYQISAGEDNIVLFNKALKNRRAGFFLNVGSGQTLAGNLAKENKQYGIWIRASTDNTLLGNRALENGEFDLVDDNEDCDDNTWRLNRFRTSRTTPLNAGCIR